MAGLAGFLRALVGLAFKPAVGALDLASKACEGIKNTLSVITVMERQRPPRTFRSDRVLRPFDMAEARAMSLLELCKLPAGMPTAAVHECYVDHFSIAWTTPFHTPGAPLLLLLTSARVVLGDEARRRPFWEVALERLARVELAAGHVILWTWEKLGVGVGAAQRTLAYNVIVERSIRCNDPAVLEAIFHRLNAVARQQDRASVV